jgi:hypothetical protein
MHRVTDRGRGKLLRFKRRNSLLTRLGLKPEDWVAIPVCALWAMGMVLWSATSALRFVPYPQPSTDSAVSIVLTAADALLTPAALLRHLLG